MPLNSPPIVLVVLAGPGGLTPPVLVLLVGLGGSTPPDYHRILGGLTPPALIPVHISHLLGLSTFHIYNLS